MLDLFKMLTGCPLWAAKFCGEEAGLTGASSKETLGGWFATFSVLCGLGACSFGEGVTGVAGVRGLGLLAAAVALGSAATADVFSTAGVFAAAALGGGATAAVLAAIKADLRCHSSSRMLLSI